MDGDVQADRGRPSRVCQPLPPACAHLPLVQGLLHVVRGRAGPQGSCVHQHGRGAAESDGEDSLVDGQCDAAARGAERHFAVRSGGRTCAAVGGRAGVHGADAAAVSWRNRHQRPHEDHVHAQPLQRPPLTHAACGPRGPRSGREQAGASLHTARLDLGFARPGLSVAAERSAAQEGESDALACSAFASALLRPSLLPALALAVRCRARQDRAKDHRDVLPARQGVCRIPPRLGCARVTIAGTWQARPAPVQAHRRGGGRDGGVRVGGLILYPHPRPYREQGRRRAARSLGGAGRGDGRGVDARGGGSDEGGAEAPAQNTARAAGRVPSGLPLCRTVAVAVVKRQRLPGLVRPPVRPCRGGNHIPCPLSCQPAASKGARFVLARAGRGEGVGRCHCCAGAACGVWMHHSVHPGRRGALPACRDGGSVRGSEGERRGRGGRGGRWVCRAALARRA
mmetsp:Transcript_51328/g.104444  ORF Transcript_51328/g.104444 Transcript_51328/m.104444 type:complete len:454 (-) Transcript_51328:3558-4919(-)